MEGPMTVSRLRPMVHVVCVILLMTIPIMRGVFDTVHTDIFRDHYAEKPWPVPSSWQPWLPAMPANTIVNFGYMLVGVYWLLATKILVKAQTRRGNEASTHVTGNDVYMMYTLCWISILYGPVQMARLIMMRHRLAVMDQWYTLPGFAWVLIWARYFLNGWSVQSAITITLASLLSYCLSLFHTLGFDVALGGHIVIITKTCWDLQIKSGTSASKVSFIKAILSCAAFVFLKLLDHKLALVHPIFCYLSGHFWSKIGDAAQIYYTAEFFFIITLERARVKESHAH